MVTTPREKEAAWSGGGGALNNSIKVYITRWQSIFILLMKL